MCDFAGVGKLSDGKPEGTDMDGDGNPLPDGGPGLMIPTLEGLHRANPGDWIIKGVQGELYPCKPDIFDATYDLVDG